MEPEAVPFSRFAMSLYEINSVCVPTLSEENTNHVSDFEASDVSLKSSGKNRAFSTSLVVLMTFCPATDIVFSMT